MTDLTDIAPAVIANRASWIGWESTGKDKLPRAPWQTGHMMNVSATDPKNYTTLDEAVTWADRITRLHVGYAFQAHGPVVGIDLDDCFEDGSLADEAREIIERMHSYTEVSPSGNGIHILVEGELDQAMKNDERGVEMYDCDRFFTFTGNRFGETPGTIRPRQEQIEWCQEAHQMEAVEPDHDVEPAETADIDPAEFDGEMHPLYDVPAEAVVAVPHGENVSHPFHGSSTGANFKLHEDGQTAICWRGEHGYPVGTLGCGLGGHHLLAMKFGATDDCFEVRDRWKPVDMLVLAAYVQARKDSLIPPVHPPYRAVRAQAAKYGIADALDAGGKTAWTTYRASIRQIRMEYDIWIPMEEPEGDG